MDNKTLKTLLDLLRKEKLTEKDNTMEELLVRSLNKNFSKEFEKLNEVTIELICKNIYKMPELKNDKGNI